MALGFKVRNKADFRGPVTMGSTLVVTGAITKGTSEGFLDGVLFTLGTDLDIAMLLRATALNANTALTGVIVGTPVTPAVAANSLIIANKTADGDILLAAQTGGNTHAALFVDASARASYMYDSWRKAGVGFLGLGAGEAVTIATGVATITKPHVVLDAEGAGTTDQLDTIIYTGAAEGDLLLLRVNATDTITVDDANINLGDATRAIAPGGSLLLYFDGTEWTELMFIAGTDNV